MEAFWGPEVKENPGNTLDGSIRKHPKNLLRKRFLSCSVDQEKKKGTLVMVKNTLVIMYQYLEQELTFTDIGNKTMEICNYFNK